MSQVLTKGTEIILVVLLSILPFSAPSHTDISPSSTATSQAAATLLLLFYLHCYRNSHSFSCSMLFISCYIFKARMWQKKCTNLFPSELLSFLRYLNIQLPVLREKSSFIHFPTKQRVWERQRNGNPGKSHFLNKPFDFVHQLMLRLNLKRERYHTNVPT